MQRIFIAALALFALFAVAAGQVCPSANFALYSFGVPSGEPNGVCAGAPEEFELLSFTNENTCFTLLNFNVTGTGNLAYSAKYACTGVTNSTNVISIYPSTDCTGNVAVTIDGSNKLCSNVLQFALPNGQTGAARFRILGDAVPTVGTDCGTFAARAFGDSTCSGDSVCGNIDLKEGSCNAASFSFSGTVGGVTIGPITDTVYYYAICNQGYYAIYQDSDCMTPLVSQQGNSTDLSYLNECLKAEDDLYIELREESCSSAAALSSWVAALF